MTELVFQLRNKLAALPLIYCFLSTRWEWQEPVGVWLLAGMLVLAGATVRAWANRHCNYNLRAQNKLATTGPYALMRNPLYIGNGLVILAAVASSGLIWMVPVTLVWIGLIYNLTVLREEPRMLERYGQPYQDYCDRVPRWVPRLQLMSTPDRRRTLLRDFSTGLILIPYLLKQLGVLGL